MTGQKIPTSLSYLLRPSSISDVPWNRILKNEEYLKYFIKAMENERVSPIFRIFKYYIKINIKNYKWSHVTDNIYGVLGQELWIYSIHAMK